MEIEDTDSTGYTPGNADAALADLVRRLNAAAGRRRSGPTCRCPTSCTRSTATSSATGSSTSRRRPAGRRPGRTRRRGRLVQRPRADRADVRQGRRRVHRRRQPLQVQEPRRARPATTSTPATARASGTATASPGRVARRLRRPSCARRPATTDVLAARRLQRLHPGGPDRGPARRRLHRPRRDARPGPLQLRLRRRSPARSTTPWPRRALTAKVTDLTHWNINAVESFAYQYTGDPALYAPNPYRSSDHDPLVLGIDLEERCAGPACRRSSAPPARRPARAPTAPT